METKRNAKIISDFLHFTDISDFTCSEQTRVFLPRQFSKDNLELSDEDNIEMLS